MQRIIRCNGGKKMTRTTTTIILIILATCILIQGVSADSWSNESRAVSGKGAEGVRIPLGFTNAGIPVATATNYYNWISMGFLYLIAAVAGSRDTRFFAILIPVFAGLFYYMGWFSAVAGFDVPGMMVFLAVLAVAYYMKDTLHERSGSGGPGTMIMNITFYLIILSAVVGLVNTSNLWGMGGMQMAQAVNNSYTNVDLTAQVPAITGSGGILASLVSDVMILTTMAFSGLRAFLSIMVSIAFFSVTITQIFPFIKDSPMTTALLVVFQCAIWLLYAKFILDLFYKPSPGTSDF